MNAEESGSSFRIPGVESASLPPQTPPAVPGSGSSFSVENLNVLLNKMFAPPPLQQPPLQQPAIFEPLKEEV